MLGMNDGVDAADVQQNKVMGILAYLGILVLVPILAAPKSRFARFHAGQGLTLFILSFIIGLAGRYIPFVGYLGLATLVLAIIGIINAAGGKMTPLPVIGEFNLLK